MGGHFAQKYSAGLVDANDDAADVVWVGTAKGGHYFFLLSLFQQPTLLLEELM